MVLDGVLNEPVWGESAFTLIPAAACSYGTGCGAADGGAWAEFKTAWSSSGLYIAVVVNDPGTLYADTTTPWNGSGVEVFLDVNDARAGFNTGTGVFVDPNTYQWCITYNATAEVQYCNSATRNITASSLVSAGSGYTMEIAIPWASLGLTAPAPGSVSGLDISVDVANAAGTARDHQIVAFNGSYSPYNHTPAQWGFLQYQSCNSFSPTDTPVVSPTATLSPTPVVSATPTNTPSPPFTPTPTPTTPTQGATLPYTEYEAEAASYSGTLIGPSTLMTADGGSLADEMAAESSGREAVELSAQGQYVTFTTVNACNSIVVRYIIPDAPGGGGISATLTCAVAGPDGNFSTELAMTSVYTWDYGDFWTYPYSKNPSDGTPFHLYDETHALFGREVAAGSTVTLEVGPNDLAGYYVIDLIDLEQVPAAASMPAGYTPITNYGAVANGTDCSADIQTCVNQNTQVWIPEGAFACLSAAIKVPAGVTIRGAGMWYSSLTGYYATLNLGGNGDQFFDFALFGATINRNDSLSDSGFNDLAGTGSELSDIWIEHEKCGYWVGNGGTPVTNGLLVTNCRIRDTYADGVNLCNGSSNSTVTQCELRNTGDDSLASWSPQGGGNNAGNTFSFDTVQNPWRADCFALYGGGGNNVINDICTDTLNQSGVFVDQGFTSNPFTGRNLIENISLVSAGALFEGTAYGALEFDGAETGWAGTFTVSGLTITDAVAAGILFNGPDAAGGETVSDTAITGAGTYGIQVLNKPSGGATIGSTVVSGSGTAGYSNPGPFIITRGAGNSGW
jgi:hypothetical protein